MGITAGFSLVRFKTKVPRWTLFLGYKNIRHVRASREKPRKNRVKTII